MVLLTSSGTGRPDEEEESVVPLRLLPAGSILALILVLVPLPPLTCLQGGNVTLSIYAKKVDPDNCSFLLSPNRLTLSILFDMVNNFSLDVELFGRVDPEACKVAILAPKVALLSWVNSCMIVT
eukprot:250684-Hanusia_phi.AAC.1